MYAPRTLWASNFCNTTLEEHNGSRNLCFSVNPVRAATKKKAKKEDIASLAYHHVDCDLTDEFDREAERARILEQLSALTPSPTYIIDSGNGYQGFWRLAEPIPNDGDYERLEAVNEHLEALLGGDSCHNIDRLMRIPGTTNLPTKTKVQRGYTAVVATLVLQEDRAVRAEDFELLPGRFVELLKKT